MFKLAHYQGVHGRRRSQGLRDRALLLIGFAGAFRRSEPVALDLENIEENELGFKVTIRQSKAEGYAVASDPHGGDVLIQQGTNPAWVNRGTKPCRIAFVLIDAKEP